MSEHPLVPCFPLCRCECHPNIPPDVSNIAELSASPQIPKKNRRHKVYTLNYIVC